MRNRNLLLSGALVLTLSFCAVQAQAALPQMETRSWQALYKSKNGPVQKIEVGLEHAGKALPVVFRVDGQTYKRQLAEGANRFEFEIPAVSSSRSVELTLTAGKETASSSIELKPVRHWSMNMVQHTHTDIGYTRSQNEILAEHLRYIDYALDYCDATDHYPEDAQFRWTCEIAWAVSEYLRCRPDEQIERLKQRVAEGRIEIAGMYLNFDELPDERTLAASLYPLQQFREAGLTSELAMQNDVNGIGWCFTEWFADAGIKYINMGTHGHRALIAFDYPTVFWWESPSGKKVLTYRAEHYNYGNFFGIHTQDFEAFERNLLTYLDQMQEKDYPFDLLAIQHSGYFTDNSPPSTNSCEFVKRWNEKYDWPKLRVSVASEFFKTVENQYASKIQTIRGAWPDWWTDGFGSGAREASVTRLAQSEVTAYQAGLSFAKMLGAKMPADAETQIDQVNRAILFYDEHTFGHSESVRNPYGRETWEQRSLKMSYAWEAYRRSGLLGEITMGLLQGYVPKAETPSVVVFNTLNWTYSGIAKAYIDHQILPHDKAFEIVDAKGNIVPAQPGERRSDGTYWALYVKDIPAMGYAQYYIRVKDQERPAAETKQRIQERTVENPWYQIEFNPQRGTISGLYDKELNKELLDKNAPWQLGEFIYEIIDSRHPMERYTTPQSIRRAPERIRFERYEHGPIWDSYRFRGETVAGRDANNLAVEFRVFNVEKKIEIVYTLRKKAVIDPEAIYIAFPFGITGGKVWLDVPGGNIEAGVDQIPGSSNDWYTVQNYAAAKNATEQVVMGSPEIPLMQFGAINTGRYQAEAVPQSTQMYSWPMNNYWVTNFNADQMGEMQWSYFIGSAADPSVQYATRFAWENRIPLLTRVLPAGNKASKPVEPASLMQIGADNLLLVDMKPVAGEKAVLLQLREVNGKPAEFSAGSSVVNFKAPVACDVNGQPLKGNASLRFAPWENKFIKLSW